ncbi:hypothetical protein [Neptuniibacter sp. QD37_11]|uniref:hypothetical protein n=1 Tax=Neptuniibacter sp. QD37_11 TaxID=3398209 RepID=UPI0039F5A5AD
MGLLIIAIIMIFEVIALVGVTIHYIVTDNSMSVVEKLTLLVAAVVLAVALKYIDLGGKCEAMLDRFDKAVAERARRNAKLRPSSWQNNAGLAPRAERVSVMYEDGSIDWNVCTRGLDFSATAKPKIVEFHEKSA